MKRKNNPMQLLLRLAVMCVAAVLAPYVGAQSFESLFNGRDLSGWEGDSKIWSVKNGAITGQTTADAPIKNNTFLIWKGDPLRNFQLELQYRIVGGNSGVQYRSRVVDADKWIVGGYQADFEAGEKFTGILYDEKGRGILALRGERSVIGPDGEKKKEAFGDAADMQKHIRKEKWNDYLIEADGDVLKHTINGQLMSETVDSEAKKKVAEGILALQVHTGPPMKVQFRNVRLRRLDD